MPAPCLAVEDPLHRPAGASRLRVHRPRRQRKAEARVDVREGETTDVEFLLR